MNRLSFFVQNLVDKMPKQITVFKQCNFTTDSDVPDFAWGLWDELRATFEYL